MRFEPRAGGGRCLRRVTFHPAFVKSVPFKHPAPATRYMGRKVRRRMGQLSRKLGTRFATSGEDLVIEPPGCARR